jgi:hypothetical protein
LSRRPETAVREVVKSEGFTGRIASDGDLFEAVLDQAEAGRPNVVRRGREWMLR